MTASVILLLIGADYLASDYCYGCTGYLVYLFQKPGREQAYKNHITTCLVSRLQRTGTARALFDALF